MNLIFVILVICLIIILHELGHFVAAKLSGVKVEQFTIGFGPAIFKKQVGETLYAIRMLPVGGAVMMKDEEGFDPDLPPEQRDPAGSYQQAGKFQQFCICFAGSLMNFLTGVVILMLVLAPAAAVVDPTISDFAPGFALQGENGLQVGDRITKINGFRVFVYSDLQMGLTMGEGKTYDITVERNGQKVTLEDVSLSRQIFEGETTPRFGITFSYKEFSGLEKAGYAVKNAVSFLQSAYKSIGMLLTGEASTGDMMGVVGIADQMTDLAQEEDNSSFWYFVAYLAVNLGFVNMLPIPGLDGGKILVILLEAVLRRPIPEKYQNIIAVVGLVCILGLFVFVTLNDIRRLVG